MNPSVQGYTIQREIGKGGMGMVYRATRADGAVVALKILPPNLVNPISAKRFQREGNALKSVQHDNVVKVHEVGVRDGLHFIAMEFVDGRPLSRVMREQGGGLPIDRVASLALDIGNALRAIHQKGMVHRDLKPGNIIVKDDGSAKLLDFGLVQVEGLTMLTVTGNVVGTPAYMSPEQCSGSAIDLRSDIYSYALLVYEMLVGQPPFRSESMYELLDMQKKAAPAVPSSLRRGVPGEIEQIILHCLEKDPAHRPTSLDEAIAVFERFAPRRAYPTATIRAPVTKAARPPVLRMAAAVVLFLLLGAGAWYGAAWLKRNPGLIPVHASSSGTKEEQGLRDQIAARYRALAEGKQCARRAAELETRGDPVGAWQQFRRAVELMPEEHACLEGLARTAGAAGKLKETAAAIRSYLDRSGQDPRGALRLFLKSQGGP